LTGDDAPNEGQAGERPFPGPEEELTQAEQLRQLTETGTQSVDATEPDEEDVLRDLYGEPDEDGIYRGSDA